MNKRENILQMMINPWLLAGELAYASAFYFCFRSLVRRRRQALPLKAVRRTGALLLLLHSAALLALALVVPDVCMPPLARMSVYLPGLCARELFCLR